MGGGLLNKHNSPKLQKFKDSNCKRKVIVTAIIISILLISGVYLYSSFALFSVEKHFNVINGEVSDPGDIYFAYYVDGETTRNIPSKGVGYVLDIDKSNCTNGVIPKWDNAGWQFIGDYSGYNAPDYTRTRCDLYFKNIDMTLTDYIKDIANYNTNDIIVDEAGGNIRYIGKNPNNYVSIDGELWRIIGVMKNINDGNGNINDRVKLIRNDSIGNFAWDTSDSSVNGGWGVNEWTKADLMKLLNPGYESESVGGSLYWNSKSGTCYNFLNNATSVCDFTNSGMKDTLKSLISDATWNLGGVPYPGYDDFIAYNYYALERGSTVYNNYQTTWVGMVGLIYPSDYGFATSGGSIKDRTICLNTPLLNWHYSDISDCKNYNWLYSENNYLWTMTSDYSTNLYVVYVRNTGFVDVYNYSGNSRTVKPVVYLKDSVKVVNGLGTKDNPFELLVS